MKARIALQVLLVFACIGVVAGEKYTSLHAAAEANDTGELRKLLSRIDVDSKDQYGRTALQVAAQSNSIRAIKLLLEKGADPNASREGQGALHLACARHANASDTAGVIGLLIKAGASPDAATLATGQTPLHAAALRGYTKEAEALLKGGASPDIKDKAGKTAADIARANDHPALAELIEKQKKR